MNTSITTFTLLLLFLSCTPRERPVLEDERFLEAYVSILEHRSPGSTQSWAYDSASVRAVLDSLGITVEEFRATVEEYNRDVRRWQAFYEQAIKRMDEKEKERKEKVP